MNLRILNLLLIIAFSFCYLEWAGGNSSFVWEAEYQIFFEKQNLLQSITHPIIMFGLTGQILLLLAVIFPKMKRWINTIGVVLLGLPVLVFFIIGLLVLDFRVAGSTLPYLILTFLYFKQVRRLKKKSPF